MANYTHHPAKSISSIETTARLLIPTLQPYLMIVQIITGILNTRRISELINSWYGFQVEFRSTFHSQTNLFSKMIRKLKIIGITVAIISLFLSVPTNALLRDYYCLSKSQRTGSFTVTDYYTRFVCKIGSYIPLIVINLAYFEDYKCIILISTVAVSFRQVEDKNFLLLLNSR